MSYQVLARKYRPRTFAEVVGQEHVMKTLANAIATGRVAHAFLFVGPRGIGKTSTARILAKALNCPGGPRVDFDPDDEICVEIAEGRSMDVLEIDGASNNSVEQIRELRDNVQYAPARGNFKIYIIDEVHMLTQAAFNALLKTLEEPPAHVKFIFATTEPHKVLPTILSRCQRFDLKRIADKDLVKQLRFIADREGVTISDAALHILARNAEGGMRDAESALDQLISFCGANIEEKDVLQIFGLTGAREVWALAEAIQAGEAEDALHQLRELITRGKDLTRLSQYLLRYFRNLLIYAISPQLAAEEMEPDEVRHLANLQPLPARELVLAMIDELTRLEEKIRFALVKEVLFEITIIRMTRQRQRVSLEEILSCLARGEPAPASAAAPARPATVSAPPVPVAKPEPTPTPAVTVSASGEELWKRATEPLKKNNLMLRNALNNSAFITAAGGNLQIRLNGTQAQRETLQKSDVLQESLAKSFNGAVTLRIDFIEAREAAPAKPAKPVVAAADSQRPAPTSEPPAPASAPAKPVTKADFENDPLIQEALHEFSARIVSVKN
ncbi:MAG: DNA polymerase III subunit gamma/tau [Verrucomicrobiales bacterium]|nr:DNA polymerase III subunit gamma/tau [Verrucomicrobiales bacterium]